MKKAILVEFSFLTRIVIDSEEENLEIIAEKCRDKILDKVHNELTENLVGWEEDVELPYNNELI